MAAPAPSDAACMQAMRRGGTERVDARCWRVGPLRIGMMRAEVGAKLGAPNAQDELAADLDGGRLYRRDVYIFPRDLQQQLSQRPRAAVRFRVLQLAFDGGDRLVLIANAAPLRISGDGGCSTRKPPPEPADADPPAFRPYQRFLGVRVGDRLGDVRRRLGPWSSLSDGGDFVNMHPLPLTLDVSEGGRTVDKRVDDFVLQADADATPGGGFVNVTLEQDRSTCLVHGFHLQPSGMGGGRARVQ